MCEDVTQCSQSVPWMRYKSTHDSSPAMRIIDFHDGSEWALYMSRAPSPDIPPESSDLVVLTSNDPVVKPFQIDLHIPLPQSPTLSNQHSNEARKIRCGTNFNNCTSAPSDTSVAQLPTTSIDDDVEQFESPSTPTSSATISISHPRRSSNLQACLMPAVKAIKSVQVPLDAYRSTPAAPRWVDASFKKSLRPPKRFRQGTLQFESKKR